MHGILGVCMYSFKGIASLFDNGQILVYITYQFLEMT